MSTTNVTNTCILAVNNTVENSNNNNNGSGRMLREFAAAVCKMNLTKLISLMRLMNVPVTADKDRFDTTEQALINMALAQRNAEIPKAASLESRHRNSNCE